MLSRRARRWQGDVDHWHCRLLVRALCTRALLASSIEPAYTLRCKPVIIWCFMNAENKHVLWVITEPQLATNQ